MFYHNILVIFRNFKRNRSTFFINLLGLSTRLACLLMIYLWISDAWSMDKFHVHDAQLYQVVANEKESDRIRTIQETPNLLAEKLAAEMPEVEMYTSYLPAEMIPMKFILSAQTNQKIKSAGQFADKDFFRVFSYPLLQGNAAQVLQRTKELGVRKVLGASVGSVVALLSKDFLKLVLVAIVIASPVAYYFMDQWLSGFAYRVELQWWVFVAAALASVIVAFLTVGFQSLRAALRDPVESLRSD
jgi:putative ABC transport system permease protein